MVGVASGQQFQHAGAGKGWSRVCYLIALGKTVLLHEWNSQQQAIDSNLVFQSAERRQFTIGMECSLDNYVQEARSVNSGDPQQLHPMGKRPDAMFKALSSGSAVLIEG